MSTPSMALTVHAIDLLKAAREVETTLSKLVDAGLVKIKCDDDLIAWALASRLGRLHAVIKEIDTLSPPEAG